MLANRLCVQGAASTRTSPRFAISTLAGRVPGPSGGRAFGVAGGVALGVLGLPPRCEKSDGMDGMGVLQSARTCENSWARGACLHLGARRGKHAADAAVRVDPPPSLAVRLFSMK
jgi:hypothetical protein